MKKSKESLERVQRREVSVAKAKKGGQRRRERKGSKKLSGERKNESAKKMAKWKDPVFPR